MGYRLHSWLPKAHVDAPVRGSIVLAAICMRLVDYKVVVAYSSVSHMSIAFSGLVSFYYWGLTRAFVMIVRYGVVSPLMFYLGNLWYERVRTRGIGAIKRSKI